MWYFMKKKIRRPLKLIDKNSIERRAEWTWWSTVAFMYCFQKPVFMLQNVTSLNAQSLSLMLMLIRTAVCGFCRRKLLSLFHLKGTKMLSKCNSLPCSENSYRDGSPKKIVLIFSSLCCSKQYDFLSFLKHEVKNILVSLFALIAWEENGTTLSF